MHEAEGEKCLPSNITLNTDSDRGTGGTHFSSQLWMGGIGDMIVSKHVWNNAQVAEYYAVADKDFSTLSNNDSQFYAWPRPGIYPEIIDVKGNLLSGSLVNGSESDFRSIAI